MSTMLHRLARYQDLPNAYRSVLVGDLRRLADRIRYGCNNPASLGTPEELDESVGASVER